MRPLSNFFQVLSEDELSMLHENVLKLLKDPGMHIPNEDVLKALKDKGADVDFSRSVIKFPAKLIEAVIELARKEEKERIEKGFTAINTENQLTFSWHSAFIERTPKVQASLGGGCPMYYDHAQKKTRYATGADKFKAIDKVVEKASETLSAITGAFE